MRPVPPTGIHQDASDGGAELHTLRDKLVRGRRWVVGIKTFAMLLFISAWTLVQRADNMWIGKTLFGGSFWTEFAVYTAVAISFLVFSLIGKIREGSIVSQVWFEVTWLMGVGGFDIFLLHRTRQQWPPFRFWFHQVSGSPWVTVSFILYVLAVFALSSDLIISFLWSGILLKLCAKRFCHHRYILFLDAADFLWLQPPHGDNLTPSARNLFLGSPRPLSSFASALPALWKWITSFPVFKSGGSAETISFCLVRGCSGLIIWAIILGYGALNCLINPVTQFSDPKGLPVSLVTNDGDNTSFRGRVEGFIVVDVVPSGADQGLLEGGKMPPQICDQITDGLDASYTYPSSQEVKKCTVFCRGNPFVLGGHLNIEYNAVWSCGSIWEGIPFRAGVSPMDTTPFVSVKWNASSYLAGRRQASISGLMSILTSEPSLVAQRRLASSSTPNENPIPGNTFKFISGRVVRIEVGRRQIYSKRGSFREVFGLSESPFVYLTYPPIAVLSEGSSSNPQVTSLTFYPLFGPYSDDIYEQYLHYTVLGGLSKTGGLYATFDLTFALLFGRSLLSMLWGGKFVTPFGALGSMVRGGRFREKLCSLYPWIESSDPCKRAEATCNFLHDFILDLNPLKIKQTSEMKESGAASTQEADIQARPVPDTQGENQSERREFDDIECCNAERRS